MSRDRTTRPADRDGPTRRQFVAGGLATGLLVGGATVTLGQTADETPTFALDGFVEAWEGVAPSTIAGGSNPPLEFAAGETYRFIWQNGDGEPHNIAFQDDAGEFLQVLRPLPVTADQVTVFDDEAAATAEVLPWSEVVSNATAAGNATAGDNATMGTNATNATGAGGDDELVAVSETVTEQGAVQAVEFTATEEMATYICTIHPTTMLGDVIVDGGATGGAAGNSS